MTGIDPEGCDLKLVGEGSQGWVARLEFGSRIVDAERAPRVQAGNMLVARPKSMLVLTSHP